MSNMNISSMLCIVVVYISKENIYDAVMSGDVYDDEDYELEHKHSDDEKRETTTLCSHSSVNKFTLAKSRRLRTQILHCPTPSRKTMVLPHHHQPDCSSINECSATAKNA